MDAKVAYWTAAFVNLTVIVGVALYGVRHVRRGEVARHRRAMLIAAALVVAFLVSYPLKVAFIGREALGTWSAGHVWLLRLHEVCVAAMLLGGGFALVLGRRVRRTAAFDDAPGAPPAPPALIARHRFAGRTAVAGAVLGWLFAAGVLAGMFGRS